MEIEQFDLKRLEEAIEQAKNGKGEALILQSSEHTDMALFSASIGDNAVAKGMTIMHTRCRSRDYAKPYTPFINLFTAFLEKNLILSKFKINELIEELPFELVGLFPVLSKYRSSWGGFDMLPDDLAMNEIIQAKERLFDAISSFLINTSEINPLFIFIESCQWLDASSVQLLLYLIRSLPSSHLLVFLIMDPEIMQKRDSFIRMNMQEILSEERVTVIDKTGKALDVEQEVLVASAPSETETEKVIIPDMSSDIVIPFTEGKPLLDWERTISIMESLNKHDYRVLGYASVIGDIINYDILKAALDMNDEELHFTLMTLAENALIKPTESSNVFKFCSMNTYELVYSHINEKLRKKAHREVGLCMEELFKDNIDDIVFDLGFHFTVALDFEKMYEYMIKAGGKAERMYAHHESLSYYAQALDAISKLPKNNKSKRDEIEVIKKLSRISNICGEWDRAIEYNEKLITIGRRVGDDKNTALGLFRLGEMYEKISRYDEAITSLEKGLKLYEQNDDTIGRAECHREIGRVYWKSGKLNKAVSMYTKGIELLKETDDRRLLGMLYNDIGTVYKYMGEFDKPVEFYQKSIAILKESGHILELGRSYNNLGVMYERARRYEEALENYKITIELAEKVGDISGARYGYVNVAGVLAKIGGPKNMDLALEYCEESLITFERLGDKYMVGGTHRSFGIIYREMWNWEKATEHFQKSIKMMEAAKFPHYIGEALFEFGLMYRDMGENEKAAESIEKAIKIWHEIESEARLEEARKILSELEQPSTPPV
jgi:tetratricopeptide (TPR) repeat protein